MPDNLCTATTKAGSPCRRKKVRGSDKCQAHGGAPGQVVFDETKFKNRCTAISHRSGERCRKSAIKGGTVCRTHGGALPAVKKKARERFRELEEPMVDLAWKQIEQALAGRMSHADARGIMAFIADRLGYVRGVDVNHTVEVKPWEVTMQHILTELPDEPDYADDIEDAEVIEYEPEPESLPPVSDYSPRERFDGPVIGAEGVIRHAEPKVTSYVDPPRRRRRDDDYD